jgi:hypothetical protein
VTFNNVDMTPHLGRKGFASRFDKLCLAVCGDDVQIFSVFKNPLSQLLGLMRTLLHRDSNRDERIIIINQFRR